MSGQVTLLDTAETLQEEAGLGSQGVGGLQKN